MELLMRRILDRNCALYGHREAVVSGDVRWSWDDLDAASNRVANAVEDLGVQRGDRVGVLSRNSAEYVAIYYACAKLGTTLVPYNYWFRPNELEGVIGDSEPSVLILQDEFEDTIADAGAFPSVRAHVVIGQAKGRLRDTVTWADSVERAGAEDRPREISGDDAFTIIYTSGTTGRPKGAVHTQSQTYLNGLHFLSVFGFHEEDTFLVYTPMFHVGAWDHLKPFMIVGGRVVVLSKFEEEPVLEAIERERVSVFLGVPATYRMLSGHPALDRYDLSSVRIMYIGGSVAPPDLLEDLPKRFGLSVEHGFFHVYGLTEAGPLSTALRPMDALRKLGSVGRPLPGVELRTVDEQGADVAKGERGEILIRGADNMLGYWRMPEATAETIQDGWLRTGDVGVLDEDGYLYIVDRAKDMIISGGENVYPKEIEEALMRHPAVAEVAVIGIPDELMEEQVLAIVRVADAADEPPPEELRAWARERLAGYKVPKRIEYVEDFPRSSIGKVLKPELRRQYGSVFGNSSAN